MVNVVQDGGCGLWPEINEPIGAKVGSRLQKPSRRFCCSKWWLSSVHVLDDTVVRVEGQRIAMRDRVQ